MKHRVACMDGWAPAVRDVVRRAAPPELALCFAESCDPAQQAALVGEAEIWLPGFAAVTADMLTRRLRGFDAQVVYVDPRRADAATEKALQVRHAPPTEAVAGSGILGLHVPLLPQTTRLVDAATIASMKDGAELIDTLRDEPIARGRPADRGVEPGAKRGGPCVSVSHQSRHCAIRWPRRSRRAGAGGLAGTPEVMRSMVRLGVRFATAGIEWDFLMAAARRRATSLREFALE